ncbi:MAG: hypothetical protein GY806_06940 [Gammaproteobacteria bacterium]|nr:hypothetical protein [Gammaproteobacteria bacterium]
MTYPTEAQLQREYAEYIVTLEKYGGSFRCASLALTRLDSWRPEMRKVLGLS